MPVYDITWVNRIDRTLRPQGDYIRRRPLLVIPDHQPKYRLDCLFNFIIFIATFACAAPPQKTRKTVTTDRVFSLNGGHELDRDKALQCKYKLLLMLQSNCRKWKLKIGNIYISV